jgi:hypothetical protein
MSEENQKQEPEIMSPELAEALDRKAAAEARTAARRKAEEPANKLRDALDAAALAEAVADHGEVGDAIAVVRTGAGIVIVKRPTASRWRSAMKDMEKTKTAELEEAAKNLVKDHLVYPKAPAYFAIAERYPRIESDLVSLIGDLARGGARALAGE